MVGKEVRSVSLPAWFPLPIGLYSLTPFHRLMEQLGWKGPQTPSDSNPCHGRLPTTTSGGPGPHPACLSASMGGNGTVPEGAGSKEPGGSLQVPAGTAGDGTHHPLGWQVAQEEEEESRGEEGLGRAGRTRLAQH